MHSLGTLYHIFPSVLIDINFKGYIFIVFFFFFVSIWFPLLSISLLICMSIFPILGYLHPGFSGYFDYVGRPSCFLATDTSGTSPRSPLHCSSAPNTSRRLVKAFLCMKYSILENPSFKFEDSFLSRC